MKQNRRWFFASADIDRITLEYLKLGELIIKFLNKNETKIIL